MKGFSVFSAQPRFSHIYGCEKINLRTQIASRPSDLWPASSSPQYIGSTSLKTHQEVLKVQKERISKVLIKFVENLN